LAKRLSEMVGPGGQREVDEQVDRFDDAVVFGREAQAALGCVDCGVRNLDRARAASD
jgi:hypothetical protein